MSIDSRLSVSSLGQIRLDATGIGADITLAHAQTERTSMRLPAGEGLSRTTTSSLKPNQRVVSIASIHSDLGSEATIIQPMSFGRLQSSGISLIGRTIHGAWLEIWISVFLLLGEFRTTVLGGIFRASTKRQNGHEQRRILGVGRDVVDVRHAV